MQHTYIYLNKGLSAYMCFEVCVCERERERDRERERERERARECMLVNICASTIYVRNIMCVGMCAYTLVTLCIWRIIVH